MSLILAAGAAAEAVPDPAAEPPQLFQLELEGRVHELRLGEPVTLPPLPEGAPAVLRVRPYRELAVAGVSFRYPRPFTFESDFSAPGIQLWTLSGNDTVLIVAAYLTRGQHRMQETVYAQELMKRFEGNTMRVTPARLALPEKPLRGRRIEITLAGTRIRHEVFAFRGAKGDVLLTFQETLGEDGEPVEESRGARELFLASFGR